MGQFDFRKLYTGFGFIEKEGSNYRRYTHSKYPFLQATVARHNTLVKDSADDAIKIINRLKELETQDDSQ